MQLSFEFACSNQFDIYDNQDSFDMNEIDMAFPGVVFSFYCRKQETEKKIVIATYQKEPVKIHRGYRNRRAK